MVSLKQFILENISYKTYKEFLKGVNATRVKNSKNAETQHLNDEIDKYKSVFWDALKTIPGAKENRNRHRIYIPYNYSIDLSSNCDMAQAYSKDFSEWPTELKVKEYVRMSLDMDEDDDIQDADWHYRDGLVDVWTETQRGPKKRTYKIGKILSKDKSLLDEYNADPMRLNKKVIDKDLLICISDHPYDVAGMSTGRSWTSCMNIETGEKKHCVKDDVVFGTLVAYLIYKDDLNIENPLGRVLIKPYKMEDKDWGDVIVYSAEPMIYSSYAGLDDVVEHLDDICKKYQPYSGHLKQIEQLYYDDFFKTKDLKFNQSL